MNVGRAIEDMKSMVGGMITYPTRVTGKTEEEWKKTTESPMPGNFIRKEDREKSRNHQLHHLHPKFHCYRHYNYLHWSVFLELHKTNSNYKKKK